MPSINLAPGTQQYIIVARRRRRRLFLLSVLILLATASAWGGLWFYEQQLGQRTEMLRSQLQDVQREIARLASEAQRVQLFEQRLSAVGALLDGHMTWDPLLQSIEQLLPGTVRIKTLSAQAAEGQVSIEAATIDIDQVAQTIASFLKSDQSVFSGSEFNSVSRQVRPGAEEGANIEYGFVLKLHFSPSIITKTQ